MADLASRPGPRAPSAYALSAATTMLWVGCVLPAGPVTDPLAIQDAATPIHRAPILLVPALLLLIVTPVGLTLARTAHGLRALLASTDAFVCIYCTIALPVCGVCLGTTAVVLVAALGVLGLLSIMDTARHLRTASAGADAPGAAAADVRLALALLGLLTPSWLLVQPGKELASLLAPYAFVALSAGSARVARTQAGLRFVASILHFAIAVHLFVTLRFTIHHGEPPLSAVGPGGVAVLALAVVVAALALLQAVLLGRDTFRRATARAPMPEAVGAAT